MKKKLVYTTVVLSGLLMVFSCGQDDIFFKISQETAPEKPLIPGHPTNMVEFTRGSTTIMYVASGDKLHWYKDSGWDSGAYRIPQPDGRILGLAATSDYLYALCLRGTGNDTVLRRIKNDRNYWENVSRNSGNYSLIQSIYVASDQLFAGAKTNSSTSEDYGILYFNGTTLELLPNATGLLSGAASKSPGVCYLSTRGKGVYKVSGIGSSITVDAISNGNRMFMGMIKLEDTAETIIVVERDGGALYKVEDSGIISIDVATGKYATGALALWDDGSGTKMLTAGIQGGLYDSSTTSSSFTHGYVEINLLADFPTGSAGEPSITVGGYTDRYQASLGKHPINHLYQASSFVDGSTRRFFASTQSAGLWSYRVRSGEPQWNAEN